MKRIILNMSKNIEKYLNYTRNLNLQNSMTHNHYCVLVHNKKVYSSGINNYRTKFTIDENRYYFPSCHAEIEAIMKILPNKKNLSKKFDLYVSRIKNDEFKNSKPCLHCINFIKNIGCIKRVIYTTGTNEIYTIEKVNSINLNLYRESSGWKYFKHVR